MDLEVKGEPIVIVGGTSGMGFAAAEILAGAGARVGLISRDPERGEEKAKALRDKGGDVRFFAGDGTKRGSVEAAIDEAAKTYGRLYGMAITAVQRGGTGPFESISEEDWEAFFQGALMMTVRACRAALPHIVANGGGSVVTTSSYSSRQPVPNLIPYITMKAGVVAMTKNLALSYGDKNVRVNCICPGMVATNPGLIGREKAALEKYGPPAAAAVKRMMKEEFNMDVALGRMGKPAELGDLFALLLSKRAGYLTGATINEDGGTSFF